jgi:hypothetical protein
MELSVKCVCPSCFNEINLAKCKIISEKTGSELKSPSRGFFSGFKGLEPLDGPYYTQELAHRQCYVCDYLLPPNIESVPSITLAVVGDNFSGKSLYIAALIHQLKTLWTGNAAGFARFMCLTESVESKYTQEYINPLFNQKRVLPATQPAVSSKAEPLIYKLVTNSFSKHPKTAANLMIYDTSGEDFIRSERIVEYARFALNTNAFIFVADPFTMEPFINALDPVVQDVLRSSRAAERLNAVISIYERYHREPEGSSLPHLPIAVMLSKSDMFKSASTSNNIVFQNPNYSNGLDLNDIDKVDGEVKRLLSAYRQNDLLNATHNFARVKFFATSATGEPPDASGSFAHVEPCRCLDPVLWILHQLGIIRVNR